MDVRALVFDVFGTVVDWRGGVAREVARLLRPSVDAAALADDWRGRYVASMERVRSGELPWAQMDALHRSSPRTCSTRRPRWTPSGCSATASG